MQNRQGHGVAAVRAFLYAAFTAEDLSRFCQDYFPPLRARWAPKYNLEEMVDEIVDYCGTRGLWPEFLDRVAEIRPKRAAELALARDQLTRSIPSAYTPPAPPDLTSLPPLGNLPPGSRLHLGRNDLFTGRDAQLITLAQVLLGGEPQQPALVAQAIQGMGGVGKTQLAVEFAYRYGRFLRGVHWLNAGQPDLLGAEVAACGEAMELSPWPDEEPAQVKATLAAWATSRPRLVIVDNLEDVQAARTWWPRLDEANVRLLVTTRHALWPRDMGLRRLHLEVFAPAESRAFLRRWLGDDRAADGVLDDLAERLGHLPLALELAGRYLDGQPWLGVDGYLDCLGQPLADPSLVGWMEELGSPTGHDLDVAHTFALSWERVKDEAARRVFRVAGWCAPNRPIPHPVLIDATGLDKAACGKALTDLMALGLLEGTTAGMSIHPLLGEYARALGGEPGYVPLEAVAKTLQAQAEQANETGLPASFGPLRAHMEAVATATQAAGLGDAGGLWNELGYHLYDVAEFDGARAAFERALTIDQARFGQDDPQVARDVNNLGGVLKALGDLDGALAAYQRALAIDEAVSGPNDPKVAIRVNNLGSVLKARGDLAGALAAYQRALAIDETHFGPDDPKVAVGLNNVGGVRFAQGDLAGARQVFERALKIDEAALGATHPNVAIRVNNLGRVLKDLGDLAGARSAYERALAIDEAAFGPVHPNVARDVNNLGRVLQDLGDVAGARSAYERAMRILEGFFPSGHASIEMVRQNLEAVRRAT